MTNAVLIMAGVSAVAALGGLVVVTRPARNDRAIYGKRIAGTMLFALALILAVYAYGLDRMAVA